MIVKDGTDPVIEKRKRRLGLQGDVYIIENNDGVKLIEDLAGHKRLLNSMGVVSTATTIEEAEIERIAFEKEQEEKRRQEQDDNPDEAVESEGE